MALTNAFYDAVSTGNVRLVHTMMKDSLLVDPSFTGFSEMERAARSLEGLYDAHDGREFITDQSLWNDDYMNKLMVQVVTNFSHERIDHLKDVVHRLRPVATTIKTAQFSERTKTTHREPTGSSYQEQKLRDQENGDYLGTKITAGAVAGAVVGGVLASMAGITVVGGAAAGAVVGGVAVTIAVNGGKQP
ncbi:hypothetical protein [Lacrimispora brassicae]